MEKWGKPPRIDRNSCPSHSQPSLALPRLASHRRVCQKKGLISVSLELSVPRTLPGLLLCPACCFALRNLRPPITRTPLPGARKAYGQLLSRDFNPLDIPPITANTPAPLLFFVVVACCAAQGNWFGFTGIYGTCRVFTIASMSRFSAGASDTAAFQTSRQSTEK